MSTEAAAKVQAANERQAMHREEFTARTGQGRVPSDALNYAAIQQADAERVERRAAGGASVFVRADLNTTPGGVMSREELRADQLRRCGPGRVPFVGGEFDPMGRL
ncbi:hypothetical protein [Paraburkholderia sp. MM5482-R1]|uniref:hypothetical protein n=1 Tax=unclassified Paraburkholderia TaxID=2615204 RepID=UPI003D1938FE